MVDSRAKGARAEAAVKGFLIQHTELGWERTPGSGALNVKHKLKGDLYLPDCKNNYCIEVKHYKDCHLNSELLTSKKPQLIDWWDQTLRQAKQTDRLPMLFFKHDRSKVFCCVDSTCFNNSEGKNFKQEYRYFTFNIEGYETLYISKAEDFLKGEEIQWIL
jgi:hypothetical protein